ncbi:DsbA family oxidoreductase [Microbaculum marinum]|uniref:DsbA family oxidoreductase n=1 Tax=Microbaculum marinum TaxID=1764581 RepID=A0AAW9RU50_9HYPH
MSQPIQLDVISDTICPWCYIGKRRLEKAMALRPDIRVDVRWRPYQLDATIPSGGVDRKEYLERKFGGPERAQQIYANIRAAGAEEDIPFAFEKIARTPNTINSHRLIRWAATADRQDAVVERLFQRYFLEGGDVESPEALVEIAREQGMDADLIAELIAGDADVELVEREIRTAQKIGVTGVPCFIFLNSFGVMGAQSPEFLAEAFDRALAEARQPEDADAPT